MVLLEKGTICAVLKHNNDDIIGFEVKIKFREKIDTLTMSFFSLETNEDVSKDNAIVFSPTDISNYLLMLPKLDTSRNQIKIVITSLITVGLT